jgi:hypothetical protein
MASDAHRISGRAAETPSVLAGAEVKSCEHDGYTDSEGCQAILGYFLAR